MKIILAMLAMIGCGWANARIQGDCMKGGQVVVTQGLNSTTRVMRSFVNLTGTTPTSGCTVNVYITGSGGTHATLSTNTQATTANPFTADAAGHWYFEVANGTYDVTLSAAGITAPFTLGAIPVIDPQFIGGVAYADTFSGADACIKIQAAIAALPQASGVVDARGLQGSLPCSANPYNGTNKAVTLLLGAATYQTTAQWIVPNKSRLIGVGRGDPGAINSTVQAANGFPSNTAVLSMCAPNQGSICAGVQIEHLAVDCDSRSGCMGIYNSYSQEESWVQHVNILRSPSISLFIDGNPSGGTAYQVQNSGPYSDIEMLAQSAGTTGSICLRMTYVVTMRSVTGITCNPDGYTLLPTYGIYADNVSSGALSDVHVENVSTGIQLGSTSFSVSNFVVTNIEGGPNVPTLIHLPSSQVAQNILVGGVINSTSGGNNLVDDANNVTIAGGSFGGLGSYMVGNGVAGQQTILTTDQNTTPFIFQFFKTLKGISIPGTGADNAFIQFGQDNYQYKILEHDGVSGDTEMVIKTGRVGQGNPCLLIQTTGVTTGGVGGGLCLNGVGFSGDASQGGVGAGYTGDLGTFIARSATPSGVFFGSGIIDFRSATGQTPGSTATLTTKWRIQTNGTLTAVTPVHFADLGTPTSGSFTYCDTCTNQSNPCTGSGSGAFAKYLNGAWDCR